jgi:hypothetical protein
MAKMTTCPDCGRTLFAPSGTYSLEQMLEGHRQAGRCPGAAVAVERTPGR